MDENIINVLKKQLLALLPPINDRKLYAGVVNWHPAYSKLHFRSAKHGEAILGLALVTNGDIQSHVLTIIAHLLDGNPKNTELLTITPSTLIAIIKILPALDEKPRNAFSYVLSQALRHQVDPKALQQVIQTSWRVNGVDIINRMNTNIPTKATSNLTAHDDATNQLLYVLGRAAERVAPASYLHFHQSSPLLSKLHLGKLERIPSARTGYTLCSWLRVGALGNTPVALLYQLSTADSHQYMNVYYRVVYRLTPGDCDNASIISGSTYGDAFFNTENEWSGISKRTLQLCISYTNTHTTDSNNVWKRYLERENDISVGRGSSLTTIHSLLPLYSFIFLVVPISSLATSVVSYATPDAVIDLDWSEMGDWHLLSLSFSDTYIKCHVDGKERNVHYWSIAGYKSTPPTNSIYFQSISKENPLRISIGGAYDDHIMYTKSIDHYLQGNETGKRSKELSLLEAYGVMVGGFSGCIGDIALVEGSSIDLLQYASCLRVGPAGGLASITNKKIISFIPALLREGNASTGSNQPTSSLFQLFTTSTTGQQTNRYVPPSVLTHALAYSLIIFL